MNETKLRYSEPLLREVVRTFVARSLVRAFGWLGFIGFALIASSLASQLLSGDRGWGSGASVGISVAAFFFVAVFALMVYRAHFHNTVGRFRTMRVPEGTLSWTDEHFTIASELGISTLPWSAVTEVWRYPRFWLILLSRSQFITLPLDCIDPEAQAFIIRKTGSKGVK